jgi:hypothetical protein
MRKFNIAIVIFPDFQKLEREARICRKLQHPNIGERKLLHFSFLRFLTERKLFGFI